MIPAKNPMFAKICSLYHANVPNVDWDYEGLRITHLSLIGTRSEGSMQVYICWGVTPQGHAVTVSLPFDVLSKKDWREQIKSHATSEKIDVRALGIFRPGVYVITP